jgi:phospholipid/cholesterol/gamma-HCH transport system permease protein
MRRLLGYLGRKLIRFLEHLTSIIYFMREIAYWLFIAPFKGRHWRHREIFRMMDEMGVGSLPLVMIISVALGTILIILTNSQLRPLGAARYAPGLVTIALMRELGPLFTGIVVAGRAGSAITARFGTMKVSEEVLALESMAINPVGYLVLPVIVALVVTVPCLTLFAEASGILGSFAVGCLGMGIDPDLFRAQVTEQLKNWDIMTGMVKSLTFALIVGVFCSYQGLIVEGGGENVGRATMVSVVFSIIMVVVASAVLTAIFYL